MCPLTIQSQCNISSDELFVISITLISISLPKGLKKSKWRIFISMYCLSAIPKVMEGFTTVNIYSLILLQYILHSKQTLSLMLSNLEQITY